MVIHGGQERVHGIHPWRARLTPYPAGVEALVPPVLDDDGR